MLHNVIRADHIARCEHSMPKKPKVDGQILKTRKLGLHEARRHQLSKRGINASADCTLRTSPQKHIFSVVVVLTVMQSLFQIYARPASERLVCLENYLTQTGIVVSACITTGLKWVTALLAGPEPPVAAQQLEERCPVIPCWSVGLGGKSSSSLLFVREHHKCAASNGCHC